MKKAVFPGSFNPIHQGHIDIIKKASKLFDFLYIIITNNPEKINNKSLKERYDDAVKKIPKLANIKILINDGELTANFAQKLGCNYLIRSGRNNIDFKYELELAAANNSLNSNLETILIIPDYSKIDYKSRLLKQK